MDQEPLSAVYVFGGFLMGALVGAFLRPQFDRCRSRSQGPVASAVKVGSFPSLESGQGPGTV